MGSCLEKAGEQDGPATYLNEVAMRVDPIASVEWYKDPPECVYLADWQAYILAARMHDQLLSDLDFDMPQRAEVIALLKWGWKATS